MCTPSVTVKPPGRGILVADAKPSAASVQAWRPQPRAVSALEINLVIVDLPASPPCPSLSLSKAVELNSSRLEIPAVVSDFVNGSWRIARFKGGESAGLAAHLGDAPETPRSPGLRLPRGFLEVSW